jgi:hypothetical protein
MRNNEKRPVVSDRTPSISTATVDTKHSTATDAPDTRDGNKDKFAWFYAMMADTEVSNAAKVVGSGCVMKMAGSKGHFKTTRKAVAALCGISQATVRRGLADLIDKRYLDADLVEGAASTYTLILPAQRYEGWLAAEREFEREVERANYAFESWLYAEKKYHDEQKILRDEQMELPFRIAVFDASIARGADEGRAFEIAKHLFGKFRDQGLELDVEQGLAAVARSKDEVFTPAAPAPENPPSGDPESDHKRADPGTSMSRPRLTDEPTPAHGRTDPGSWAYRPRLMADAATSADDQTHKSFKDSERPVKVFQDSESEPALRDALPRALRPVRPGAGACDFCGSDGLFRDPDGYPVVLGEFFNNDEEWIEYPVDCQHSMAGNLAEIRRRKKAECLLLFATGFPEIDAEEL